ncbi:MAG: hypothetical protein K2N35_07525 [Muribaculaceae bacterium]|nr:hypothetical protein [Muribaculaceae bacterium]
MISLIFILIMLAIILSISLAVSIKNDHRYDDRDYRNNEGDHLYYDKSIIEKKVFHRLHPKEAARSIARLFRKDP